MLDATRRGGSMKDQMSRSRVTLPFRSRVTLPFRSAQSAWVRRSRIVTVVCGLNRKGVNVFMPCTVASTACRSRQ
jgi:hypothetical protein